MKSYVYVVTDGSGWCKIGKANNMQDRLSGLQTGNPREIKILYKHPCKSPSRANMLEALTHARLKNCRGIGEWFWVTKDSAINAIQEMARKHSQKTSDRKTRRQLVKEEASVKAEPIDVENVLETEGLCD